jgi:hypothetical protein
MVNLGTKLRHTPAPPSKLMHSPCRPNEPTHVKVKSPPMLSGSLYIELSGKVYPIANLKLVNEIVER